MACGLKTTAVAYHAGHARRIVCYHPNSYFKDKRRANRAFRRCLKRQVKAGIQAWSEFTPSARCYLYWFDIA